MRIISGRRRFATWTLALFLSAIGNESTSLIRADEGTNKPPLRLDRAFVFGRATDSAGSVNNVASESDLIGPAKQPQWTARRAFAETDIYVIPPGEIEFNQFYISSHSRNAKPENLFETEFEFGLPWRTQFDVEVNYAIERGRLHYDETLLELPHALADWGKIPLNPAVAGAWRFINEEPDAFVIRLLLAEEVCKKVHFGANLTYGRQIGGAHETAYELNVALSHVMIDSKLTVGMEILAEFETETEGTPGVPGVDTERTTNVMLGPSILWKPTRTTHLGLVPLFGLTSDSPVVEAFVVFGFDFGPFGWNRGERENEGGFGPLRKRR
ncbi:MAG: hypothetical protein HY298_12910 [Verrucomicrobia bacterium]|nr:hypothetical protein [Verrucomicrobiota bacterium]